MEFVLKKGTQYPIVFPYDIFQLLQATSVSKSSDKFLILFFPILYTILK